MAMINERDRKTLQDRFAADLGRPVKIVYFTQGESGLSVPSEPCTACRETQQMLQEVVALSDQLSLEVHDFVAESALAEEYGIDKIPALVMESNGRRLRYFGMPSGYEFVVLIEGLLDVARDSTSLSESTRTKLQRIDKPVHLQVFVTPT